MTLIRFVQRASILAGITLSGIAFHGGSATAQTEKFCVVASNGKTACGTLKAVERACVSTDNGVVCGKFKSVAAEQGQEASTSKPVVARKEVNNFVYTLKGCRKSDTTVKCELSIVNKRAEGGNYINTGESTSFVDLTGKSNQSSSSDIGGVTGFVKMSQGVDYSASITFNNVSEQVVKAQVLNLNTHKGEIQFRNVSFSN